MFEQLKKAIEKHYKESAKEQIELVKNGYLKKWAEEHHKQNDNFITKNLTPAALQKFINGTMTRAEAVEKATQKALAQVEKDKQKTLAKIDRVAQANDLTSVNISVEWAKNRTWGANPTATVLVIGSNTYTGTASGCGYDKQSTAISEAFNKSNELLKLLYTAEEKRLKSKTKQSRRDFIGYGSGGECSPLPYFEGGCGVSVYYKIFETCGFKFENVASGQMFEAYTIRKAPKINRGQKWQYSI